ncbi:MAG: TetR/AcrR family transcriptional regulator [Tannerella sp.]|nr:TetR/AcrR family transcriptional regulator [Tannerella sp.]
MAIRAEKRQLIMDTALQLFAEHGFESTSIERIARQAGISVGLLYSYFKSKDDLLEQILLSGIQKLMDNYRMGSTMREFLDGVEQSLDMILDNSEFFKLYSSLSMQPNVTPILGKLSDVFVARDNMVEMYKKYFGGKAVQELLLMAVIMKGFPIIALYGDIQHVFPIDTLKGVVMDCFMGRDEGVIDR